MNKYIGKGDELTPKEVKQLIERSRNSGITSMEKVHKQIRTKLSREDFELTEKEKKELDHLHKLHKKGKSKSYTIKDIRKYVNSKLKK